MSSCFAGEETESGQSGGWRCGFMQWNGFVAFKGSGLTVRARGSIKDFCFLETRFVLL